MWVMTRWNIHEVVINPSEQIIYEWLSLLDNKMHIGLSIFYMSEQEEISADGADERIIVMGGERMVVECWDKGASQPSWILEDQSKTNAFFPVNCGGGIELSYEIWRTVPIDIAYEGICQFLRDRKCNPQVNWVTYKA